MKRALIYTGVTLIGVALVFTRQTTSASAPVEPVERPRRVSAPGRVEPVSEEIKIGSSIGGKIARMLVEEGDTVRAGQVLATIDNADFVARAGVAKAQLADAEARLRRVLNGARPMERREAAALVREAEAVADNARAELDRRDTLFRAGDISRADVERTEREFRVAKSRLDAAKERHSFIDADARDEDRLQAQAEVELGKARLAEAQALLAKTIIRSPVAGTVLRKHFRAGEAVPDNVDLPVITVGDTRVLRVRVEVDETDIARVAVGARAYVTADAFPGRKFVGRVIRVGSLIGAKNVRTDRPSERVDTKVLETLIELEESAPLPSGLRVDAFIG